MSATARSCRVFMALCLAALPLFASAQSGNRAQVKMNQNAVAVKSNTPVPGVEAVQFSGQAIINSRLVPDPIFGKPTFILLFDLSGVTGVGAVTGTRYVLSTQEYSILPHLENQNVEFVFPMATDVNAPISRVRTGLARFVIKVDVGSGVVKTAAANFTAR